MPREARPAIDEDALRALDDDQAWAAALAYAGDGQPFAAHEACEVRWRSCDPRDRALWQALAKWGAARTHEARGNAIGTRSLSRSSAEQLAALAHVPDWLDYVSLQADLDRMQQGWPHEHQD